MRKHAEHLRMGRGIRQLCAVLPLAATLTMASCSKDNANGRQEYGLLASDSIKESDYYGHVHVLKHVSINLYDDKSMQPTQISQLRWGTPKEEMPKIYHGEEVFAKKVRLCNDSSTSYIAVFENEYGIAISKDQPCFIVDQNNKLVYFGNKDTFRDNMKRYIKENHLQRIPQKMGQERMKLLKKSSTSDSLSIDNMIDDINDAGIDTLLSTVKDENFVTRANEDIVKNDQLSLDTLLMKKDNPSKE